MARPLKLAAPLALVLADALDRVPDGPLASVAVTWTPLWLTALPPASRSWITGCWPNPTPLCAELDGCVVIVSFVAGPVDRLIALEVAAVKPPPLKVSV